MSVKEESPPAAAKKRRPDAPRRALPGAAHAKGLGRRVSVALAPARRGVERAWDWTADRSRTGVSVVVPFAQRVWQGSQPGRALLSPVGWIVIGLTAGSLAVGFALGWVELTGLGFTLATALVASSLYMIGRSTYAVLIELSPIRVVVGERAMGRMAVRNNGTRGLLPSTMELPVGSGLAEFSIGGLKPGEEHDELFAVPTHRRAVVVAGPAVSVRGDHLGLFRRTVRWTDPIDLFVHPITIPVSPSAAGLVRDLEGQVTKKITQNDISFHALRAYVPGDDRRHIHWRSSARTGELMVRQFEETRRSQLMMLHSEFEADYASEEEFELAVSVTASIGAQVIRDGTTINVLGDTRRLRCHSPGALLDDTCRLDLRQRKQRDARTWARVMSSRLPTPSVLMIICGSEMSISDLRSIEILFPADTTIFAFRVEIGASPTIRPVSRMRVVTVGALSDLPGILRRAAS